MMRILLTIFLVLPQIALAKLVEPEVINTSSAQEVKLGKDAEKALQRFDKNLLILEPRHYLGPVIGLFESYPNELPQAVAADFNGDGVQDIIVMGLTMEKSSAVIKAVLLVSNQDKYTSIPLDQWNAGFPRGTSLKDAYNRLHKVEMYLGLAEKREVDGTNVPENLRAFKVEVYLQNTNLYFYKGGAIHKPLRRFSNDN